MKRFSLSLLALGLLAIVADDLAARSVSASRKNSRCFTPEEKRLNRFWHDYYDSARVYNHHLSRIDWVAYYKNHACPKNQSLCNGQCIVQHDPVVVVPGLQHLQPTQPPYAPAPCFDPCCGPFCGH